MNSESTKDFLRDDALTYAELIQEATQNIVDKFMEQSAECNLWIPDLAEAVKSRVASIEEEFYKLTGDKSE